MKGGYQLVPLQTDQGWVAVWWTPTRWYKALDCAPLRTRRDCECFIFGALGGMELPGVPCK